MTEEQTSRPNEAWDAVAPAWEMNRDRIFRATKAISDRLVELVDARPGQTVLELAAGTGETGFLVTGRLGAEGRLISTDFSDAMVAAARRGAAERGLSSVDCRLMDAQSLDFPDGSVDAVLSRFGLMLVADPGRALREARRVLRPAGRLVYAVWGAPDANPWITLLGAAVIERGHTIGGGAFGAGGMFSLAEPEQNLRLVSEVGFGGVTVDTCSGAMRTDNIDDYWDFQSSISGPITVLRDGLPWNERDAVRAAFRSAAEPFRMGVGYELPFEAVIVHATR